MKKTEGQRSSVFSFKPCQIGSNSTCGKILENGQDQ